MKITIPTNFNFYQDRLVSIKDNATSENDANNVFYDKEKIVSLNSKNLKNFLDSVEVSPFTILKSDLGNYKHLITSSIIRKKNGDVSASNDLILKIFAKDNEFEEKDYFIQTGIFTGVIYYKEVAFHIVPHCGEYFLNRMLNVSNHIYLDNKLQKAEKSSATNPFFYILVYLFINALEKARILGYPQQYHLQADRSSKYHGQLNIAQYIKKDIPFNGKLSIVFRDRQMVQEIVDVLFSALRCIEKAKILKEKTIRLKSELQPFYSGKYCNGSIIRKALKSPALCNPMYRAFRNALRYAEIILKNMDLSYSEKAEKNEISGFLIDASELWEVYLEKLLENNFHDWDVYGQAIMPIYHDSFFTRDFYPDLVMKKKDSDEYAVFDAKFKRMTGRGEDVDRGDLHQIHTYASYYEKLGTLKACGLLYPCDMEPNAKWTSSLFNLDDSARFLIDGINTEAIKNTSEKDISREEMWSFLQEQEQSFIERLKKVL